MADPCEQGGTCFYVDSVSGADTNIGSKAAPWKTLNKVSQSRSRFTPGSWVLFRRGASWPSEVALGLSGITGTEVAPVTFGAYGALTEPLPRLKKVNITSVSNVTLRDLEVAESDQSGCVNVTFSDHVIVQGVTAHHCSNNGIRFAQGASFGTIIDCLVRDIPANDALSVHESTNPTPETKVGNHFWLVDNRVPGPVKEQPIDIATGGDNLPGAKDMKVVGNVLANGSNGCIALGHNTSVGWVLGNIMGKCMANPTGSAVKLGGFHGKDSGRDYRVSGNLIFWNSMSSVATYGEAPMTQRAWLEQNTFVSAIGLRPVITIGYAPASVSFERNILWTTGSNQHLSMPMATSVSTMGHNVYIPGSVPGCLIGGQSLSQWQRSSGLDVGSSCGAVPGLALPLGAAVDAFTQWTSSIFLDNFKPDTSWAGCADHIGAIDCATGRPRVEFKPIPGYTFNNGYGWAGPLVVRQRYPLPTP